MAQGYGPPPGGSPYGQPPSPYGQPPSPPPYGQPPAPYGGGPPTNSSQLAAITERSAITVVLLTFVTCGIYHLIWKYKTTEELKAASGDESLNPTSDLLFTFLCCAYGIYTDYRNSKKCAELLKAAGSARTDQSTIVIICHFVGVGFASMFLIQEDLNALARIGRGQPGLTPMPFG